jgi:hypothetical protein
MIKFSIKSRVIMTMTLSMLNALIKRKFPLRAATASKIKRTKGAASGFFPSSVNFAEPDLKENFSMGQRGAANI